MSGIHLYHDEVCVLPGSGLVGRSEDCHCSRQGARPVRCWVVDELRYGKADNLSIIINLLSEETLKESVHIHIV